MLVTHEDLSSHGWFVAVLHFFCNGFVRLQNKPMTFTMHKKDVVVGPLLLSI